MKDPIYHSVLELKNRQQDLERFIVKLLNEFEYDFGVGVQLGHMDRMLYEDGLGKIKGLNLSISI